MKFKGWVQFPSNRKTSFLFVIPIIISQVLQRLYPIVDSRYINFLGNDSLLIHSVQYNFIIFGQFIGAATAISCLVFWRRQECVKKQGSIFIKHLMLVGILMLIIALILGKYSQTIMTGYKVNSAYIHIASIYLCIGLCNMVLQAIYGSLDGMLVASGQQRKTMSISFGLLIANILLDSFAINIIFSGIKNPESIYRPIIFIGASTTIFMLAACLIAAYCVIKKIQGWEKIHFREIIPVWQSELGVYLIRGITPFIYALQLSLITATSGFLATYQLTLQLSYIFCLPLFASMQLAVRNASEENSKNHDINAIPIWWNELFYTGLIPAIFMLLIGICFPVTILSSVYHYIPPLDHVPFIPIFFFACLVGQFANALTVPIRSRKKNYLITRNFFLSEFIVMLGGTQILLMMNLATPITIGLITLLFASTQLLLNLHSVLLLKRNTKERLIYEAVC